MYTNFRLLICSVFLLTTKMVALAQWNHLQAGVDALRNSQYEHALEDLEKASRELTTDSTEEYLLSKTMLGHALIKVNKWDEGIALLKNNILEAQKISVKPDYWRVKNTYFIADALFNLGKYELAEEMVMENITAISEDTYPILIAKNYNLLGIIFWEQGNNNLALEYMEKSIRIEEEMATADLGTAYNDLGLIYQDIDINTSLDYYQKALDHYKQYYPRVHAKNAILLSNLGLANFNNGNFDLAQYYFEESEEIWEEIYPNQNHPSKAYMLNNLGRVAYEKNEHDVSLRYFTEALSMYRNLYSSRHPEIANTLNLMAISQLKNGDFEQGLDNIQHALIANSEHFESTAVDENPQYNDFISSKTFLSSLLNKAKLLRQQYTAKTLKIKDLKCAMAALETADSVLNVVRQRARSKKDKLLLGKMASQIYQEAVALCYLFSFDTQQSKKYIAKAFYFSEKAKGIVLLESINASKVKTFSGIPDSLLRQEKHILQEIGFLEQQIAFRSADQLSDYKSKLFDLNRTYEALQQNLENHYSKYYNLKYRIRPVKLTELQRILNPETIIMNYMVADHDIYVFTISQKKVKMSRLSKNERLEAYISYFLNCARYQLKEYYTTIAYQLYKEIFPSRIKKSVEHVVIVPDGKLTVLPMEPLLSKRVDLKNGDFSELPYLIKEHAFSYAYSATLWYQNSTMDRNRNKEIAVVAPIEFQEHYDLPGSEKESDGISKISAQNNYSVNLLLRDQANEETIKSDQLENYSIIHFATHGQVYEVNPDLSYINLNQKGIEDGDLLAGEVYNLKLNADLLTLSACEVGLGKYSKGEGMIGLGRAFMYAGAKNLILSLWKVSDKATSELMIDFYTSKFANSKPGYHAALRQAKLNMINQKEFAEPFYWSPFVLVGN